MEHISDDSAQEAALTRSNATDDTDELSLFYFEVDVFQCHKLAECLNI